MRDRIDMVYDMVNELKEDLRARDLKIDAMLQKLDEEINALIRFKFKIIGAATLLSFLVSAGVEVALRIFWKV